MTYGFLRSTATRTTQVLGGLALLTALSGCAMGDLSLSGPVTQTAQGSLALQGKVHGGEQPVIGSTIQLWVAGSTGYGTGSASQITKTVTTAGDGTFSISGDYTCPSGTSQVYITATGGNPGLTAGTNNAAIKLVAALGNCSTLASTPFIFINEISTAAAAYALGQFFGGADVFGAPSTAQAQNALVNAFSTVPNLVSTATGAAVTSSTLSGAGGSVTMTPESDKLQTVADIISACVNSDGGSASACQTTLFPDAAPSTVTAPVNTLQAAVDLSLYPNNPNIAALYGLQTASSPFVGMTTQPTDFTLAIKYVGSSTGVLSYPLQLALDAAGNVWVANANTTSNGSLSELSPAGVPLQNITNLATTPLAPTQPVNLAIDGTAFTSAATYTPSVWLATTGTGTPTGGVAAAKSGWIFQYNATSLPSGGGWFSSKSSSGITIDKGGNIWADESSASANFSLVEFPAGTVLSSAPYNVATPTVSPTFPGTTVFGYPNIPTTAGGVGVNGTSVGDRLTYIAADLSGNIWGTSGSQTTGGLTTQMVILSNIVPPTGCPTGLSVTTTCFGPDSIGTGYTSSSNEYISTFQSANYDNQSITGQNNATTSNQYTYTSTSNPATITKPYNAIPVQSGTGVWITDANGNAISTVTSATTGATYGSTASVTAPRSLAMDGGGNLWVANNNAAIAAVAPATGFTSVGGSVSEFTSAGAIVSPITSSTTTVNPGYMHAALASAWGIGVDPSGNVWVADNNANNTIVELVGAAVPVVTPVALALANGTVGAKP